MATIPYRWTAHDGIPGDGSSGNQGPALLNLIGTESNPKKEVAIASFDPATDEHLWFQDVFSGGAPSNLDVDLYFMANATTATTVRWGVRVAAVTPADTDTPIEHAEAAASTVGQAINTTEARRLIKASLTGVGMDSLADGDAFWLLVYRDADGTSGTDDCAVDAELVGVLAKFTV